MATRQIEIVKERLSDAVSENVPLSDWTTIRLGGPARCFVQPQSVEQLVELLQLLATLDCDYRILGGGSNLLPGDDPVEVPVIHPGHLLQWDRDDDCLRVGAGVSLSAFVARANALGLAGAHVLAGIPGQVGGALVMNAGGRYGEIADLVRQVSVVLPGGTRRELEKADLRYAYRHSELPPGAVVVGATLALRRTDDIVALKRESGRILKEKNAAQPTASWNFGCMFKNPPELSAGRLLDQAGMRGLACGGARISTLHANFVENLGQATAREVATLIEACERAALDRFGITLEREVRVWEGSAKDH